MAFKVRQSKFRHLFGDPEKYHYDDIRPCRKGSESCGIRGNEKRIALPWDSGAKLCVIENDKHGRFNYNTPMCNNKSAIMDHQFSPFNSDHVMTAGEDGVCRLFELPEGGLKETLEAEIELRGHQKCIQLLDYHPSVEGLMATTAKDCTCRLWDIEEGAQISKFDLPEESQITMSLQWRMDGSLLGIACKDKTVRIFDPRQPQAVLGVEATASSRPMKFCWAGVDRFISTGFSPTVDREFSYWDIRAPSKPLYTKSLDKASGVLMPFYDDSHSLLFLTARGDGNVRYFEIADNGSGGREIFYINDSRSTKSMRGFCFVNRRALKTEQCEVMRALKLEQSSIIPMSFKVPRKSSEFQEDLFPDCPSMEPALDVQAFLGGKNSMPKMMSMRPGANNNNGQGQKRKLTVKEENRDLKQRVTELEKENASLKAENDQLRKAAATALPSGGYSPRGQAPAPKRVISGQSVNSQRSQRSAVANGGGGSPLVRSSMEGVIQNNNSMDIDADATFSPGGTRRT